MGALRLYGAKARIIEQQTAEDILVLNADDKAAPDGRVEDKGTYLNGWRGGPFKQGAFVHGECIAGSTEGGEDGAGDAGGGVPLKGPHNVEMCWPRCVRRVWPDPAASDSRFSGGFRRWSIGWSL